VLVLLIACANLAGLLLARATMRRKEIAMRLALGATRGRIVRQLLTESVLLATLGGVLGVLLAQWMVESVSAIQLPAIFPISMDLRLDWRVLSFAVLASVATGLLFGLLPAWQTTRLALVTSLKDDAGNGSGGRARLRGALVTAQIALSLVLLIV